LGRILTNSERLELVQWAEGFQSMNIGEASFPLCRWLADEADLEMRNYWSLAQTARNEKVSNDLRMAARRHLFRVRVTIERAMVNRLTELYLKDILNERDLSEGKMFGRSLKQGVSLRLPLLSCNPTEMCHDGCYAHDGLDASKASIVRGCLNGALAQLYDLGNSQQRERITTRLRLQVRTACRQAIREATESGWSRRPRIRLSHVGELPAYPEFTKALADMIIEEGSGRVTPVVYTRHPNAVDLDTTKIVVNFTIDSSSADRKKWAPRGSRIVYSAWDGVISDEAEVNFLEHHFLSHSKSQGNGSVCPATQVETEVRSCDACRCDLCFRNP
jgi:hypothetical protein